MTSNTDRLPAWTVAVPVVALGADLALHGSASVFAALALIVALVAAVMAAVHHAEVVALRVGEPFGAILLALAVTVIELGLIVSIMLGDQPEPTLMRDTIHAVVVLVLHGIAGLCIVVGALRHREQEFRTEGAQAYLIVLLPMVAITLVLPNFTTSAPGPYYTPCAAGLRQRGLPAAVAGLHLRADGAPPRALPAATSRRGDASRAATAATGGRVASACCWWRWWRWCCWPRACRRSSRRRWPRLGAPRRWSA